MMLPDDLDAISKWSVESRPHSAKLTEEVRAWFNRLALGRHDSGVIDHEVRGVGRRSAVIGGDRAVRGAVANAEIDLVEPDSRVSTEDEVTVPWVSW